MTGQSQAPAQSQEPIMTNQAGRLGSKDREDAGELFSDCHARLTAWVRRLVIDEEAARDIAAEAFTRLLSNWSRLDNPRGYLYIIAANLARDHWRKAARERRTVSALAASSATVAPNPVWEADLRVLIEALPPLLRSAFVLHYCAGFGVREIGTILGRPEGTIKSDLHYARLVLKVGLRDTAA